MSTEGTTIDRSVFDDLPKSPLLESDWFKGAGFDLGRIQQRVRDIERLQRLDAASLERTLQGLADRFRELDKTLGQVGLVVVEAAEDEPNWNDELALTNGNWIYTAGGREARIMYQAAEHERRLFFYLHGDDGHTRTLDALQDTMRHAGRWWQGVRGDPGPTDFQNYWMLRLMVLSLCGQAGLASTRQQRIWIMRTNVHRAHLMRKGLDPNFNIFGQNDPLVRKSWYIELNPRVCGGSALAIEFLLTSLRQAREFVSDMWFAPEWFERISPKLNSDVLRKCMKKRRDMGRLVTAGRTPAGNRYEFNARVVAELYQNHRQLILKAIEGTGSV